MPPLIWSADWAAKEVLVMAAPWEDMVLDETAAADELKAALDRRNAEVARIVKGIQRRFNPAGAVGG
jgi:hypothetical protein